MFKLRLKRKSAIERESKKAGKLLSKLFSLRVTKIFLIILFVLILAPIIVFLFLKPKPVKDITYGVTFSKKYATEMGLDWKEVYLATLDDLGARNLRLIAYWDDVEKVKDTYDYSDIKWQLEEAEKRNAKVIMSIGRKVPRYPECFEPTWWKDTDSETIQEIELYDYIKTTVTELKEFNSIVMWQVENEPFWPFGECHPEAKKSTIVREIELVKELDNRPIIVQDSGEGGVWYSTYKMGDYLGISMYRKIWYDFWGVFFDNFIYFKYPLAHWTYKIKAELVRVPYQKIIVTELQAEPWGPGINSELTQEEKDQTMSRADFFDTINYAQKAGFSDLYLWGVEWWYFEMTQNNNPFFWNASKALFN